jgi:CHAT domain-containing protein
LASTASETTVTDTRSRQSRRGPRERVIRAWLLLAYAVVIVTLAIQAGGPPTGSRAWRDLLNVLRTTRHVDPRITDVPFAERVVARDGSAAPGPAHTSLELLRAVAVLDQAALDEPTPTAWARAAIARLLIDDTNRAVTLLEQAVRIAPNAPSLRSDLAAAYIVRAERFNRRLDLVRALDSAQRVTASTPNFGPGWFNQALALEQLGLVDEARKAWQQAAVTNDGGWADEAAARATMLESRAGRAHTIARLEPTADTDVTSWIAATALHPDLVGEFVERRLLRRCAQAVVSNNGGAGSCFADTRAVGSAIASETGEATFVDLVDDLQTCGKPCAVGWLHHLAALDLWDAEEYGGARDAMTRANQALSRRHHPSPIAATRLYLQTNIDRLDGNRQAGLDRLDTFRRFVVDRRYWTVAGRLEWQSALMSSENGSFGVAITRYLAASEFFTRARNREGRATVEALVSQNYQFLDDLDQAWEHELEGLAGLEHARMARRVPILSLAAILASASNLDAAALAFRAPLIREAREQGSQARLVNRLAEESGVLRNLGLLSSARERIAEAAEHAKAIEDPALASLARALVQTWHGRLLIDEAPLEGAAALGEAVAIYRRRGDLYAIPELQLDRGRAFAKAIRLPEAESAFVDGIAAAEEQRRRGRSDAVRAGVLSARWDLYASLIELRLRRDEASALTLLHDMRAVNLAERLGELRPASGLKPEPGTVFLEYAMLPSALHGWVTTAREQRHFVVTMPLQALSGAIDDYRQTIARREATPALQAGSHALYETLIQPVAGEIASADRLVIVPDGPLHDLPFATLRDPERQRFLVEDVAIVVTPSLNFQFGITKNSPATPSSTRALVIGNPERKLAVQDRVPQLRYAGQEAHAIAALHESATLAVNDDATREFFLKHARHARVVHFAGHALVSETRPQTSRLLFAASARDPVGALYASDIEQLSLASTRLVVLAACDTGRGRLARGEGVVGLVRAFLSAGVPSVAATLWAVDDRATASLFAAFHREWAKGAESSEALRIAQLELIHGGAPVADWGGALIIGRSTNKGQEE